MSDTTDNITAAREAKANAAMVKAQAMSNARQYMADANQAFADGLGVQERDDVHNAETRAEVRSLGLGSAPVKASNDAAKFVTLYHAYEGRSVPIPRYMGPQRITERFPYGDSTVPDEFWGRQVWHMTPQVTPEPGDYPFQCRLSVNAPVDVREEMTRAGLAATCRKKMKFGGFSTQFEADEHFRIKHPRRWQSYQRFIGVDTQKSAQSNMESLVSSIRDLVTAQAEPKTPATKSAAKE